MKSRVNEICRKRGMSLSDLSEQIGIKQSNLSQSLKGNPTIGTLEAIAKCLGVRVSDLFDEPSDDVRGYLEVRGDIRKITGVQDLVPITGTFGIRPYVSRKVCKKDLKAFFISSLSNDRSMDSFAAVIDGDVLLNVIMSRTPVEGGECLDDCIFLVSLHKAGVRPFCFQSSSFENSDGYGNVDMKYMFLVMWAEIIGFIDPHSEEVDDEF